MRPIDRLQEFMSFKGMSPYTFERYCSIANGYLKKQARGKGTIGSEIISKVQRQFPDLSLNWLLTGLGEMIERQRPAESFELKEPARSYGPGSDEIIRLLKEQISVLEASLADKDKIIQLLEAKIENSRGD